MRKSQPASLLLFFGLAVRARREELALSQEELSFDSDLDRTYISGIERGVRNPTLQTMQRVAAALKVTLSTLVRSAEGHAATETTRSRRHSKG